MTVADVRVSLVQAMLRDGIWYFSVPVAVNLCSVILAARTSTFRLLCSTTGSSKLTLSQSRRNREPESSQFQCCRQHWTQLRHGISSHALPFHPQRFHHHLFRSSRFSRKSSFRSNFPFELRCSRFLKHQSSSRRSRSR